MMRGGPLRQIVRIERQSIARDDRGQDVATWGLVATVAADIHPLAGRELERAAQVSAETTWRAILRFSPGLDLTPADRIVYQGRTLEIIALKNVGERNQMLEIDLKEAQ